MNEKLFAFTNLAMPFWLIMMLLPTWRVTKFLANTAVFPICLGVIYSVGVITAIAGEGLGFVQDFGSAAGVIRLLSNPDFALLVWLHILCFDQAVGHYIYRDNMEHRYVPVPVQSVILFLVLMFGPLGFLCYLTLRAVRKRARVGTTIGA